MIDIGYILDKSYIYFFSHLNLPRIFQFSNNEFTLKSQFKSKNATNSQIYSGKIIENLNNLWQYYYILTPAR